MALWNVNCYRDFRYFENLVKYHNNGGGYIFAAQFCDQNEAKLRGHTITKYQKLLLAVVNNRPQNGAVVEYICVIDEEEIDRAAAWVTSKKLPYGGFDLS